MSHKLAFSAGFLVVVAVATPHLGGIVSPVGRADAAAVQVIAADQPAAAYVPAATAPAIATPAAAPTYGAAVNTDAVYGDVKTPGFDPEHPPADMGEPG